jgi:D-threo-aldose 1-dehydrogenase
VSLPTATLGRTGIETARLGLGLWGMGNPAAPPSFKVDDDETLLGLLRTAFAAGITLLDSAEVYANEERLGALIAQLGAPADLVVSTKFGHGKGFAPEQIRDSVDRSLAAFGLDSIPLFMVHDPRTQADMDAIEGDLGTLAELRRLQDAGKIGHLGVATGTLPALKAAVASDAWDVIQFPRLYTLLNQQAAVTGLLEDAKAKNIGTILTSPFAGNLLGTGVHGVEQPLHSAWPAEPEVIEAVGRMQAEAEARGIPLAEAAVAFPLTNDLVDVVVFGAQTVAELEQDLAAAQRNDDPGDLRAIAAAGSIDPYWVGGPDFLWPFPEERMPEAIKQALAAKK